MPHAGWRQRTWRATAALRDDGRDGHRRVGADVWARRRQPAAYDLRTDRGDHRTVVGAQTRPRYAHLDAGRGGALLGELAQPTVRSDPAADHEMPRPVRDAGVDRLRGQDVTDRLLERRTDIGDRQLPAGVLACFDPARDGALEPGEGEVEAVTLAVFRSREASRKGDRTRVTVRGRRVDVRTARVRQTDEPCDLVVRLTRRVVHRLAEHAYVGRDVVDEQQRRVPAAHQQGNARRRQSAVFELVDRDVPDEMVHAVQRLVVREREGLRRGDPDQQRARQAGPAGDRDRVDLVDRDTRISLRLLQHRNHGLQMRSARDLRDDTAEARVLVNAARNGIRQQLRTADDADARLVT